MSDPYHPPRPFNRTSRYGSRIDPVTGKPKFHAGEDWAAPEGTPIPAATPGTVVYAGFNAGFGNTVIVRTTNGYSLYAHMHEVPKVEVGQQVWPGDIIGGVGNTGTFSRGNHLHYSTITSGTPNAKGNIGLKVDEQHTTDPALFDTAIRYPNQTLQAGRAMFGPNDTSDAPAFGNRRSALTDASPFHQFDLRPPDRASTFADRFGNWTPSSEGVSAPAVEPRGLPTLINDQIRKQGQQAAVIPSAPAFNGGAQPIPFLPDESEESFADRFGDKPPVRRLSSWIRPR
jgi:hypothetical protein